MRVRQDSNSQEDKSLVEISKLNWKKVVTSDGVTIGELQGGEVNDKWQVTHVHVGLDDAALKEFKLKKPFLGHVLICLPISYVRSINDAVTLNKSLEELRSTRECQEFTVK
jgi:sporulation protein YlmC with PRC-barrel domain